jgi:hypothetical protein
LFKKFAMVLAPFLLTPLGLVLTDSAVYADTYVWTAWVNCYYNPKDYTAWRAYVQVRSSDSARRPIRIQYGNGNTETVRRVNAWDSRNSTNYYNGGLAGVSTGGATTWTSPYFYPTWLSTLYPRYANVQFDRGGGTLPACGSQVSID